MALLDGYITVKEASEIIGCSIGFIRTRIYNGILPSVKLGSRHFVVAEDVKQLLEQVTPQNDITDVIR